MSEINKIECKLASILSDLSEAVLYTNKQGEIRYVNSIFEELFGYSNQELTGKKIKEIFPEKSVVFQDPPENIQDRKEKLPTSNGGEITVFYSVSFLNTLGKQKGKLFTFQNIDLLQDLHKRKMHRKNNQLIELQRNLQAERNKKKELKKELEEKQKKIDQLSQRDQLTKLLNRRGFCSRAENRQDYLARQNNKAAVLVIDINRFQMINERLGSDIGDLVLNKIARRLEKHFRECDLIARPGGDEFLVFLDNIEENQIEDIAERIIARMNSSFKVSEHEVSLNVSLGISLYPRHGDNLNQLIQNAEIAIYKTKDKVQDYRIYSREIGLNTRKRFLKNDLKKALERKEFFLEYQPLFSVQKDEIVSVEALLRWNHPELGRISPVKFIPLAEETKLIIPIGEWVLRRACHCCHQWQKQKDREISVSVNISVNQLLTDDFAKKVEQILNETGLKAEHLILEIVEYISAHNKERVLKMLKKLKKLGVKLALDDFGSGFSSLAYIKNFPIDNLKIDQSFISGISMKNKEKDIIVNIINMAHNLNLKVVGEGIEKNSELNFLSDNGCDAVQGYYLARPTSKENITKKYLT